MTEMAAAGPSHSRGVFDGGESQYPHADPDARDLQLIVRLHLEDIDALLPNCKGKGRAGGPAASSDEVSLELYRAELEDAGRVASDRLVAMSLGQAMRTDHEILEAVQAEEDVARSDRQLALELDSQQDDELPVPPSVPSSSGPSFSGPHLPVLSSAESSFSAPKNAAQSAPRTSPASRLQQTQCVICTDARRCVLVPCGDYYCYDCLGHLFVKASADEELYPPRCCREEVPLSLATPYLTEDELAEFTAKSEEYTTKSRVYCYKPSCSTFISPKNINGDTATCPKCRCQTCIICKHAAHAGDCPSDTALNSTLQFAAKHGWQRCKACHSLVDRSEGCNHMTCRCGAEWCYGCGQKWWKTCGCSDYVDNHFHRRRRTEELAIRDVRNQSMGGEDGVGNSGQEAPVPELLEF